MIEVTSKNYLTSTRLVSIHLIIFWKLYPNVTILEVEFVFEKNVTCHLHSLSPGGPLAFEIGYNPRKKIHVFRVVFQDQAIYPRISFRGAKPCKIWKKRGVFLVRVTNFEKNMTDKLTKTHAKMLI